MHVTNIPTSNRKNVFVDIAIQYKSFMESVLNYTFQEIDAEAQKMSTTFYYERIYSIQKAIPWNR